LKKGFKNIISKMFTKQSSNIFNQKVTKLKCLFNILQETFLKIIQNVQHPFPVLLAEPTISILSAIMTLPL